MDSDFSLKQMPWTNLKSEELNNSQLSIIPNFINQLQEKEALQDFKGWMKSKKKNLTLSNIPNVIHQVLPAEPSFRLDNNASHEFKGWSNENIVPLIDEYLNGSTFYVTRAKYLLLRTTYLWRFLVLHKYGGVFSESDTFCKVKLAEWLVGLPGSNNYTEIYGIEDGYKQIRSEYVGDRTFASAPFNPSYKKILDRAILTFPQSGLVPSKTLQDFRIGFVSDLLMNGLKRNRTVLYSSPVSFEQKLFLPVGTFSPSPGTVRNLVYSKSSLLKVGILTILIGDEYGQEWNAQVIENRENFVKVQNSPTFHYLQRKLTNGTSHPVWQKIVEASILHEKKGFDWLWLLDGDSMIMNGNVSLHQMIRHIQESRDDDTDVIIARDCTSVNAGSFFLRLDTDWAKTFLPYYAALDNHREKIEISDFDWDVFKEQACLEIMISQNIMGTGDHTAIVEIDYFNSYVYEDGYCNGKQWRGKTDQHFADLVVHSPGCKPGPVCVGNFMRERSVSPV